MKKFLAVTILAMVASLSFSGCGAEKASVLSAENSGALDEGSVFDAENSGVLGEGSVSDVKNLESLDKNILIIVGEGGPSGKMFIRAASTYQKEFGGSVYYANSGDEFVEAVKDFVDKNGKIDHFEYFGHGNNVALFVNQEINKNGSLYANDPVLDEGYVAASIYEIPGDIFTKYGWIKINGCNIANGYPDEDTLAQRIANYFDVDVVAPIGPTEFSKTESIVDPINYANYLSPDFSGDVYMVSTYGDKGYVTVSSQEVSDSGFSDVRKGENFEEGVAGLKEMGLEMGECESGEAKEESEDFEKEGEGKNCKFLPYKVLTYGEALKFCKTVFGVEAKCDLMGYGSEDKIRNLHALQMMVDASGAVVEKTSPWHRGYTSWAASRGLLTKDFINKKWYTRGEMAELAWNFKEKL